jgi:formate hydrogenlyase subunit 6/NADH:ubiquinone oxidoreductase subunit I
MCIQICPVSCLSLSEISAKGLHRIPNMEKPTLCIACGFCAEDCPVDAIKMVSEFLKAKNHNLKHLGNQSNSPGNCHRSVEKKIQSRK